MISFRLQLGNCPLSLNGLPILMVCFNDLGLSTPICTLQGYEQSAYLSFYLGVCGSRTLPRPSENPIGQRVE